MTGREYIKMRARADAYTPDAISRQIRVLLADMQLTQYELSQITGIPRSTISRLARGEAKRKSLAIVRLLAAIGALADPPDEAPPLRRPTPRGERRPCLCDGCKGHAEKLGLCNTHYQRFRQWGDPRADVPLRKRRKAVA